MRQLFHLGRRGLASPFRPILLTKAPFALDRSERNTNYNGVLRLYITLLFSYWMRKCAHS